MTDIKKMLAEREVRYGSFERNAEIMQELKRTVHNSPSWETMPPSMRESMEMILHKCGRVVGGDPFYIDNWIDIAGYAQLIVNELMRDAELVKDVDAA